MPRGAKESGRFALPLFAATLSAPRRLTAFRMRRHSVGNALAEIHAIDLPPDHSAREETGAAREVSLGAHAFRHRAGEAAACPMRATQHLTPDR